MKATFIEKDGDSKKFEMCFSPEEFDAAISRAYKANKDKFRIDGFRKGKAPRKLIENMYGQDIFYEEALNDLLQSGYPEALNDLDLDVIAQPQLDADEIKSGQDVVIKATVLCFPEREIKDYKGVEVEKQFKTVTDEELDDRLERERKRGARMESVEDRAAENDDTVIIDFTGYKDGEEFQGGKGENFELKLGSGQFIPGFEEQLVGAKPGDEVEVKFTFPEEYHAKDLAGADAVFKVKVHEIKTEVLPELDDDFASDVSEFDTLDEYKKDLREQMQKAADDRAVEIMKDRLLESVYKSNGLELPQQMIDNETDSMIQELQQQLQYQGLSLDQYLQFSGTSMKDLREQTKQDAEKRAASKVILRGIINQEDIKASDEEIEKEIQDFAEQYGNTVDQVKKMINGDTRLFADDVQTRKALDFIFDNAVQVEPKEEPAQENADEDKEEEDK